MLLFVLWRHPSDFQDFWEYWRQRLSSKPECTVHFKTSTDLYQHNWKPNFTFHLLLLIEFIDGLANVIYVLRPKILLYISEYSECFAVSSVLHKLQEYSPRPQKWVWIFCQRKENKYIIFHFFLILYFSSLTSIPSLKDSWSYVIEFPHEIPFCMI